MSLSVKQDLIRAFFDEFARKIGRLRELNEKGLRDEAFTLCVVYIDRLACANYGPEPGHNAEAFCQALRELGGNPLFGMIHPGELLQGTKEKLPGAMVLIESLVNRQPGALLSETELSQDMLRSSLPEQAKKKLISHLWCASMANICYAHIRNPQVHGPGSNGFTFDRTTFDGKKGVKLDFEVLYDALHNILARTRETSIRTGEWFGRADFLKSQSEA
jgi:hypothetical protein